MSIYTITLKRELLNSKGRQADCGQASWLHEQSIEQPTSASAAAKKLVSGNEGQVYGYNRNSSTISSEASDGAQPGSLLEAINAGSLSGTSDIYDSPAGARENCDAYLSQLDWLDCLCGVAKQRRELGEGGGRKRDKNDKDPSETDNSKENLCRHSSECLEFRRKQLIQFERERLLQEQANQIEHSVNVTLEVTANLKQPNRIVWYKNDQQLTSSEKPILYNRRGPKRRLDRSGETTSYTRKSSSKRSIQSAQDNTNKGQPSVVEQEEEEEICVEERTVDEELVKKCVQESNDRGSKLTIHDIQDEDYGQYTCRLIGVDGNQVDIRAQLKQDKREEESGRNRRRILQLNTANMDEVIEVKEGDLNIEMGIQILPETNEDEELMSEEEKAEFIENTTITWFKDDVKLNEKDPEVNKLFQFSYDQNEGFHRLVVRRATKETEGVYTCLVENESGTSSCSTQLVVGPGNKPKLTSRLQDVTVYVGQSLEFRIKSTGLPPIDSCQWFKDDELIIELANESKSSSSTTTTTTTTTSSSTVSKSNERISMSRSEEWLGSMSDEDNKVIIFKLCIDNLKLDDTGRYKCRIINEFGYDETDCAVKVLQEIIEEHEEIEETIEETTRLGGGKKSTREEAEETVVTEEQLEESREDERRSVKRQRQEAEERSRDVEMEAVDRKAPRFLRVLEDTETTVGETVVLTVALDDEDESARADEVRFSKDGKTVYSSRQDGESREWITSSRSKVKIRSYEEVIEVEETTTTTRRRYSRQLEQRRARLYEIRVENVQLDQMGSWECYAEKSAGNVSCKAEVEVFAEPKIITDLPEGVRVQPEREIRLTVEASGSPTPVYSWFKDGLGIAEEDNRVFTESKSSSNKVTSTTTTSTTTTTSRERRRSSLTSSQRTSDDGISVSGETLIIRGARPEDAGLYTCKVENRLGQVKSRDCRLTIIGHGDDLNSAPRIIKDFSKDQIFQVDEGESVSLRVLAEGHPNPKQYWFKDTEEIIERVTRFEIESEGQEYKLKIKRSSVSDSGKYKVVLRNDFGETESRTVEVRVEKISKEAESQRRPSAPTIMSDSQDKVVGLGSNVSFDVQVGGHPKPFVTWFKNGRRMTESGDGRVSFVEEETITTIIDEEEDTRTGKVSQTTRKETSTMHKLVITNVRESDEAIYSLKAENDLGSTKSSLVSLTVDKRMEATDEVSESKARAAKETSSAVVEEETTTTVTQTTTTTEQDDELDDVERRKQKKSSVRRSEEEEFEEDEDDENDANKKRTTKRTTRTTTTTTTTTQEEEEEEEAAAERRRKEERSEKLDEQEQEESSRRSKRRTVVEKEEAEEEEEEEEERVKRRIKSEELREDVEEEDEVVRRRVVQMDVDEDEEVVEEQEVEEREKKSRTKKRDSVDESSSTRTKRTTTERETRRKESAKGGREDEEVVEEELEEELEEKRRRRQAPRIVSAPKKVVAGLGSSPMVEVEVETSTVEVTETKVTWLKDGQPIPSRLLRDNHLELLEESTPNSDIKKHRLRINSLRSSDVGTYKLKVENPFGETETEPIELELDRTMRPGETPKVTPAEIQPQTTGKPEAPRVTKIPEEIVAGIGSSPVIEAEVEGQPKPDVTWFKDGQPITPADLATGHLENVELPTENPDVVKQGLKINNLKPADVAAYHVKAENPLGEVESEPTNLRIDRSMGPKDEPVVTGVDKPEQQVARPSDDDDQEAPSIVSAPKEVVGGRGSSPVLEVAVKGKPEPEITWLKDGQPIKPSELADGHLEVVKIPTDEADVVKQALKINSLKPADVAAYQVKAVNPLGETESEPTNVRLDRSMGPRDEPVVTENDQPDKQTTSALPKKRASIKGDDGEPAAPTIVSAPKEVVAGRGSSPVLEAEVSGKPEPEVKWFKDGQPITAADLADGHLEIVELPTDKPDTVKQGLKINSMKPADVAAYHIKAENPLGEAESEPTNVRLDRSMGPSDEPVITQLDSQPGKAQPIGRDGSDQVAPAIVSAPKEVVAGRGSSPVLEAQVSGKPEPEITWFKDGQPITDRQLSDGHLEIVNLPCEMPDTVKQGLKINDMKPADVAAYHIKAENPLGEAVSEPTKVKLDRSMGPSDEPVVTGIDQPSKSKPSELDQVAPKIVSAPTEVVAGRGSSPVLEAEVSGKPEPEITWFKDGEPITNRQLSDGHLEVVDLPCELPDTVKKGLKINDMKPADVAAYHIKAENPLGEAESEPCKVKLDRSMGPGDEPIVTGLDATPKRTDDLLSAKKGPKQGGENEFAPNVISIPEEIVAGPGGSPMIVAEVEGLPKPEITWFKDGQPITPSDLATGHLEIVELPTDRPDVVKQALKINNLKPADVAAYHLKAENPLGEVESEPTNLRIDRSMGPKDEPVVTGVEQPEQQVAKPSKDQRAPSIVSAPREIVAGRGSSPVLEVAVKGKPEPEITWLKDGQPIKPSDLADGHLEVVKIPTDEPDVVKQALKINSLKPADVAAYQVKAVNPLGEAESEPTNVRLDRSMGPRDEPVVTEGDQPDGQTTSALPKSGGNQTAPKIVRAPREVVAGRGSSPVLEVEVSGKPEPEVKWFKDGQPITAADLADGHLEIVELPTDKPDTVKQGLKINSMKPTDVAAYHIKAENPLGEVESEPTNVRLDRSMGPSDEPMITQLDSQPGKADQVAPAIVSAPKEIVAGRGSSPVLEAQVSGKPEPEITWFKDGKPITDRQLSDGHLEVVNLPCNLPDTVKQALKINDMKPTDVAAYHIKAENPLGEAVSEPAKVKLDKTMGPNDEPVVTGIDQPSKTKASELDQVAPKIVSAPSEIVAGRGSSPVLEVQVTGKPEPEITWFKDGKPITDRQLSDGHLEVVNLPCNLPDTVKQALKINDMKPTDVAAYHIKAENPLGEAVSVPAKVKLDKSMGPSDEPVVTGIDQPSKATASEFDQVAPKIVSAPTEIVAGRGSSPVLEVQVSGKPEPEITWFKDGKPITDRQLSDGHLEVVDLPCNLPDTVKQGLKINDMKPADVAAYHIKAENPLGEAVSEPAKVKLDKSMGPSDEPIVSGLDDMARQLADDILTTKKPQTDEAEAPSKRKFRAPVIKRLPRRIVAGLGSSPVIEIEVSGEPKPEIVWFKNGKRIDVGDAHFTQAANPETGVYSLTVNNLRSSDEAVYSVEATNEAGTVESGPIELVVDRTMKARDQPRQEPETTEAGMAPEVVSCTEEVVAGVGSAPVLEVVIRAVPQADVTWFKDGLPLDVSSKFETTSVQVDSETVKYVLKIHGLKPIDVGAYHLRAENPLGCTESEPSNVRIDRNMEADAAPLSTTSGPVASDEDAPGKRKLRAPVIKRLPRRIVAGLGSNPVIEIEVSGEPKPEIVWFKNGRQVTELRNRISFEEGPDGVFRLCFTNLKATDQAEYTVVASNEAGTVESAPITLVVDKTMSSTSEPFVQEATGTDLGTVTSSGPESAPQIKGLDDREVQAGGTVKLEAEVTGNPKPQIKWLKDGDEVELNVLNEVPDSNKHSLTLKNVNDLYDGVYSLEASNPLGVARKDATIKVVDKVTEVVNDTTTEVFQPKPVESPKRPREPEERQEKPFIKKGLKFSQVNQGRSIKFEVQVDGKYDELIWMKDGQQINLPISPEDIEEEEVEEVTTTTTTDVRMDNDDEETPTTGKRRFPPKIIRRPRNVVAGPGSRIAFEVEFEGEPLPTVSWFKDNERLSSSTSQEEGKIIVEEVSENFSRLIIEDVQAADVGSYHVVVENTYGSEKTIPVTLELDTDMVASDDLANTGAQDGMSPTSPLKKGRGPRILVRPRAVHALKGSKVAFEVVVSGEPKPIVNWFRDGRLITQTSDGHVLVEEFSDGCVRLVLDNIADADVGLYQAVAENKLGSERTIPVSLTIDESGASPSDFVASEPESMQTSDGRRPKGGRPPRILLRPKHLQVSPGQEVALEVQVVGQSKPSIVWYKDGERVRTDSRVRVEQITDSYQRLVISEAKESDSGSYTVSAENDFGVSMSQPAQVRVQTGTVEETEETTTTTTTTETFFERFVDDEGEGVGPGKGRRAPRFTIKPRNKKAPVGGRVDFEVCVKGEPKPDVVWYKNGRRIHTGPDGRVRVEEFSDGGSKLVIEDLEETDHGVYAAEARNEWGSARTEDVQLRVTERREVSERTETTQRGSARVTTKTKKTRSHYTFSEERHGYVTLTINDAQMDHDGDYKLVVRNKWGEASTQAPLVVIPKVEPRGGRFSADRSGAPDTDSSLDGRESARRTPFDELEEYGHELDRSVGIFGSESRYQSGEDTYLLQLRDTEFPLRLRKYLRFGARQSPSLRSNLMDAHWGAGARVTVRERRKFREVMDEEIDDEKRGLDLRPSPMRLQKEVGTCGYAAAQLEHLRVEAASRVARKSEAPEEGDKVDMMPPFFRVKLKDAVVEESASGQQDAHFVCLAAGEPAPEYTWFRNDIIITPGTARMLLLARADGGSELRIRDPRLHDSGCFKCVARNVHGNVTTRARLRVASRPSRPEPPEFGSVTSHQAYLEWRPPRDYDTNAAEVLGYRLEMSSGDRIDDCWTVVGADIGHEYYVVDELKPATNYSFRVSARNKFGWSDSSYSCHVTTCREGGDAARLIVEHEKRARQFVSDIIDPHLLRLCEEDKLPRLNYQLELEPVKLNGSSGSEKWFEAYGAQSEIARGRFSVIAKAAGKRRTSGTDEEVAPGSRDVAIKALLLDSMSAAQTKNEFDILRSLQHEKVVRLEAAYKDDDMFVFVLERLSGLDVLTYLSSFTSYNEELVSRIICQVMDAIEYLHFRGMCLLELLPDNVVMTDGRSSALKLVDFSSARFVPRSGARVPSNSTQNVEYCPPEVIAGHEVSTASDVWCIGVLTYVLLSGFSPFRGETEEETRENVRLGRYKYDHIYGNCTPEVTRFLINVFKKHSSKRPTIEQLYENKWLLPNEFMIRKRQHATFKTDKIVAFAEQFHKSKSQPEESSSQTEKVAQLLAAHGQA